MFVVVVVVVVFCSHPFSHAIYSTSSIVFIVDVVSRRVRESDKSLGCVRANRSLYILSKISIFFVAIAEILFAWCIRLKLPVRADCTTCFDFQFWFRGRLLNEELMLMRWHAGFLNRNSSFKTFLDAYWNLDYVLLLAIVGISVLVDPKLNLVCFVFSSFQSKYRYLWDRELSPGYKQTTKQPDRLQCEKSEFKDFFWCPSSFIDAWNYL